MRVGAGPGCGRGERGGAVSFPFSEERGGAVSFPPSEERGGAVPLSVERGVAVSLSSGRPQAKAKAALRGGMLGVDPPEQGSRPCSPAQRKKDALLIPQPLPRAPKLGAQTAKRGL